MTREREKGQFNTIDYLFSGKGTFNIIIYTCRPLYIYSSESEIILIEKSRIFRDCIFKYFHIGEVARYMINEREGWRDRGAVGGGSN